MCFACRQAPHPAGCFGALLLKNTVLHAEALIEGQTLILPAHKLSARDKEILAGIGPWSYRTYPVRAGETLEVSSMKPSLRPQLAQRPRVSASILVCKDANIQHPCTLLVRHMIDTSTDAKEPLNVASLQDICSKRNITRMEMEGLNPSVDLDNLEPNQVLLLLALHCMHACWLEYLHAVGRNEGTIFNAQYGGRDLRFSCSSMLPPVNCESHCRFFSCISMLPQAYSQASACVWFAGHQAARQQVHRSREGDAEQRGACRVLSGRQEPVGLHSSRAWPAHQPCLHLADQVG